MAASDMDDTSSENIQKKRRKSKRKELRSDLNNVSERKEVSKSDTENEDRIKNDISDSASHKEKNTNIVKERKKKKEAGRSKSKKFADRNKTDEKENQALDQNIESEAKNEVLGVFIHECEVLGKECAVQYAVVRQPLVIEMPMHYVSKSGPRLIYVLHCCMTMTNISNRC